MNRRHIATIALFGSIWGFFEATLGGVLHLAHLPFTGTIMTCIGFSILYGALRSGLRPVSLATVGLVAASFKFIDCWLFGIAPYNILIVNPATAIAMQGLAFALVFGMGRADDRILRLAPRFLITAAVAMVAFNAISLGVFGWQTEHTVHPWTTALTHLPLMALGSTFLVKAIAAVSNRTRLAFTTGWQIATATICAVLAIVVRWAI